MEAAYDMDGIVDVSVCAELALDIFISQHTHLWWQVLSVSTQQATVKWNRRKKGVRNDTETAGGRANGTSFC